MYIYIHLVLTSIWFLVAMAYACPKYSSMSAAGTDARCTRILLAGGREPQNQDSLVPGVAIGNQPGQPTIEHH